MSEGGNGEDPIAVSGDSSLGSPRLAAALAAGDPKAIARALRQDVVIVPLTRDETGAPTIRVFQFAGEAYELALFSSVSALTAFLADDGQKEFDVQRGSAFRDFLTQHRAVLGRVVLDPAGPHPAAASVDEVLDALTPHPDDDDVAWIAGP